MVFISDTINNRFLVDFPGGVEFAGVHLILVGLLAVVATEPCTQAATPAPVPPVVLPESRHRRQNRAEHIKMLPNC